MRRMKWRCRHVDPDRRWGIGKGRFSGLLLGFLTVAGCDDASNRLVVDSPNPPAATADRSAEQADEVSPRPAPVEPRVITLTNALVAYPDESRIEFQGICCLDAGPLEQVVCAAGTREHESLIATDQRPSLIHAALLLAGLTPGEPGRWTHEQNRLIHVAPRGDAVEIVVRYQAAFGMVEESIRSWIVDAGQERAFPRSPWIFAGSRLLPNPPGMEPGEHYAADYSGSIVGLVTFGDELIGFSEVLPDEVEFMEPQWQVNSEHVPAPGTKVTVVIRRAVE